MNSSLESIWITKGFTLYYLKLRIQHTINGYSNAGFPVNGYPVIIKPVTRYPVTGYPITGYMVAK